MGRDRHGVIMGCFIFKDLCIQPHAQVPDPRFSPEPSVPDDREVHTPQGPETPHGAESDASPESPQLQRARDTSSAEEKEVPAGLMGSTH
jgi:hypothetical protein